MPAARLSSVLLPEPLRPTMAANSPAGTSSDTPSSARTTPSPSGKSFTTASNLSAGMAMVPRLCTSGCSRGMRADGASGELSIDWTGRAVPLSHRLARERLCSSLCRPFSALLALSAHELWAEREVGCVLVVCPAQEPDPRDRRPSAARDRLDVVVLEPGPRFAALAVLTHERALAAVALVDGAPDGGRDVPGVPRAARPTSPGAAREFLLFQLLDQCDKRTLDHLRDVAGRHGVPQQRLRLAKQVMCGPRDGDLEREPLRRQWSNPGPGRLELGNRRHGNGP